MTTKPPAAKAPASKSPAGNVASPPQEQGGEDESPADAARGKEKTSARSTARKRSPKSR